MPAGRPRKHDREQISIDLIEWAKKPDSINLCKFCALYDPPIPPSMITNWAREDEEFRRTLETARAFLGFRREEWLNTENLHVKGYDLNASTYDFFLKEEKRQQAEFESSLKKEETQQNAGPVLLESFQALMSMMQQFQESKNPLNNPRTNNNNE